MNLPDGWLQHPDNPAYMYHTVTNQVALIPQEQVAALPPVLPPTQEQAPTPAQEQAWGQQDLGEAQKDLETGKARSDFSRDGNFVWVNFPRKASEESIISRFLPPWGRTERKAYIESFRHRIYSRLVPDPPENRDTLSYDCLDLPGGPGNCDICAANDIVVNSSVQGADEFYAMAKRRPSAVWQMLNTQDPQSHYQTLKDSNGQEYTGIVPGLFRMGPQLHNAVLSCFRNGDFTHHQAGYPVELIRKETGKGKYDVVYTANHMAHHAGSIDNSMVGVLYQLINLRKECIIFNKKDKFQAIAQNILSYYGGASHAQAQVPAQLEQWVAHPQSPGWEYNPVTRAVRQIQQAPPPAPVAAQPVYQPPVPPPAVGASPMAGNPPPPPPVAPGLAAGVQPSQVPPVAAPGMPSAVGQQPVAAPVPMSPDQLQNQFVPSAPPPPVAGNPPPPPPPIATDPNSPPF